MEPTQLIPVITTALTVLGTLVVALGFDRAPREIRLLTRLAEAAGHAGHASPGGQALDVALRELAEEYAEKARLRRGRKLNWAAVTVMIFFAGIGSALVYGLSMLAIGAATLELDGWQTALAVAAWTLVVAVSALTIGLLVFGIPKLYDHSWSAKLTEAPRD